MAPGLRLGGGVGAETATPLAALGQSASTTRVRATFSLGLDLAPPLSARVNAGAAAHLFIDEGVVVGVVWSPLVEGRLGLDLDFGERWRLGPGVTLSSELVRIEAARGALSDDLAPVTAWAGVELGYSP